MTSNSAKLHRFKGGWIKDWMGFDPMTTPNVLAGIAGVVCMRAPKIGDAPSAGCNPSAGLNGSTPLVDL